jgi:hypothetical protein
MVWRIFSASFSAKAGGVYIGRSLWPPDEISVDETIVPFSELPDSPLVMQEINLPRHKAGKVGPNGTSPNHDVSTSRQEISLSD